MLCRKIGKKREHKKLNGRNEEKYKIRRTKNYIIHTGGCKDTKTFYKEIED